MAARQLAAERGAATWRDMAEVSQVGYRQACSTVRNMERAGDLMPVGAEKRAHSRRWMTLYAPAVEPAADGHGGGEARCLDPLDEVLRNWGRTAADTDSGGSDGAAGKVGDAMPNGP